VPRVQDLYGRFFTRFRETAQTRLERALELLGAGASAQASAIQIELYSLAGEAAFLGCREVHALARQGETFARQIPSDPKAVVACMRALRALGRALETLEPPRDREATDPAPAPAPARPEIRGRILLADDSKLSADLLTTMFSEEGLVVEAVSNHVGLERALATLRIDLALSDVNMPELDCATVCRRVREVAPRAPVVLISGLDEEALARECQRVSADGYVPRERGLTAVVERVIAELAKRRRE
jgi:CheY-like chemotaxis protein